MPIQFEFIIFKIASTIQCVILICTSNYTCCTPQNQISQTLAVFFLSNSAKAEADSGYDLTGRNFVPLVIVWFYCFCKHAPKLKNKCFIY